MAMDLLRFSTAGSVDDGKSTLIGRLLFDTKGAYEDQIASIRKNGVVDLSLLTDGLRAEREQGITIDVAYRFFATSKRKFIIADTPGHEQYTRNMATGASTADLTIVLIDARKGVLPQSRRHAYIASLLGIPRVAVAINKMDLVGYREDVYDQIVRDFAAFSADFGFQEVRYFPVSALAGDNVVSSGGNTPWYSGVSLLEYLEAVPISAESESAPFRLPVQYVIRPNLDFRGFAGQIVSGKVRPGDSLRVLPSGKTAVVKSIASFSGDLAEAYAPMSTTLTLTEEIDISRGDILTSVDAPPSGGQRLKASLVWMDVEPLRLGRPYLLKHTTKQVRATVASIRYRVDVNTMEHGQAGELALNEIAVVVIETQSPLFFDTYRTNRKMGSFVLIDTVSNATAAAGMLRGVAPDHSKQRVTDLERWTRQGHKPATIEVPRDGGLAYELERALFDRGLQAAVVDDMAAAGALAAAGLIAILRCGAKARPMPDIIRELEEAGVVAPQSFAVGEGI